MPVCQSGIGFLSRRLCWFKDFFKEKYTGEIDTLTGFALVASFRTCFVWQHAQALKGIPTCYIFACPWDQTCTDPPFHGLFPHGPLSSEPGLVLISHSGEIRFWDNIGIGLAGGEHYSKTNLGLTDGELVTDLLRADVSAGSKTLIYPPCLRSKAANICSVYILWISVPFDVDDLGRQTSSELSSFFTARPVKDICSFDPLPLFSGPVQIQHLTYIGARKHKICRSWRQYNRRWKGGVGSCGQQNSKVGNEVGRMGGPLVG